MARATTGLRQLLGQPPERLLALAREAVDEALVLHGRAVTAPAG